MRKTHVPSKLYDTFVRRSWWVLVGFFLFFSIFESAVHVKAQEKRALEKKLTLLYREKDSLLERKAYLNRRIHSFQDWKWISLLLKEKLAVQEENELVYPIHKRAHPQP